MHNGNIANTQVIDAFNDFIPHANTTSLCVKEVPEMPAPVLGSPVELSLRGVVGLYHIIIKIIVSVDTELLCARQAEDEFITRYQQTHKIHRTLKTKDDAARRQVKQYVKQCRFPEPQSVDDIISFLLSHHLVSR